MPLMRGRGRAGTGGAGSWSSRIPTAPRSRPPRYGNRRHLRSLPSLALAIATWSRTSGHSLQVLRGWIVALLQLAEACVEIFEATLEPLLEVPQLALHPRRRREGHLERPAAEPETAGLGRAERHGRDLGLGAPHVLDGHLAARLPTGDRIEDVARVTDRLVADAGDDIAGLAAALGGGPFV